MIDASGGIANFIAILIPAIMGTFYGFRCLFQTEGFIEQYGLGAASEFMVKLCGTYTITQGIVYILLLIMSPVGAWSVFAFGTIQATLFLIYGYTTVNGKWAQVDGVKATAEGYIVPAILLVFHLYIMFTMGEIIYA
jgi:hypothetical protein|tara:strand:+ start:222 stop:632 length:411 start_codon:yes stop_codon:yes gene_type:complete